MNLAGFWDILERIGEKSTGKPLFRLLSEGMCPKAQRDRQNVFEFYLLLFAFSTIFVFGSIVVVKSAGNEIRSRAIPLWKALPSQ